MKQPTGLKQAADYIQTVDLPVFSNSTSACSGQTRLNSVFITLHAHWVSGVYGSHQDEGAKSPKALSPKTLRVRRMTRIICRHDRRLQLLIVLGVRREHKWGSSSCNTASEREMNRRSNGCTIQTNIMHINMHSNLTFSRMDLHIIIINCWKKEVHWINFVLAIKEKQHQILKKPNFTMAFLEIHCHWN